MLKRHLQHATQDEPLTIYVGSCPDYSHKQGLYTHEALNGGVSLLTQTHLNENIELLEILDKSNIPYKYVIMIADVEATDEIFCQRFTNGDEEEFLARCEASRLQTEVALKEHGRELSLRGDLRSSSFFGEFGRERFMQFQRDYQQVLLDRYGKDSSFSMRVTGDTVARMDMYRKMYDSILKSMDDMETHNFLVERTIRTMAQYLTLGRLIGESATHPAIIVHPTRNKGMFNSRNKFLLSIDGSQPQPTIPVFEMKRRVY